MTESFCLYKLFEITKIINKFSCESNQKKKKNHFLIHFFNFQLNIEQKRVSGPFVSLQFLISNEPSVFGSFSFFKLWITFRFLSHLQIPILFVIGTLFRNFLRKFSRPRQKALLLIWKFEYIDYTSNFLKFLDGV